MFVWTRMGLYSLGCPQLSPFPIIVGHKGLKLGIPESSDPKLAIMLVVTITGKGDNPMYIMGI